MKLTLSAVFVFALASVQGFSQGSGTYTGWPPNAANMWSWTLASLDSPSGGVLLRNVLPLATADYTVVQAPPDRVLIVTDTRFALGTGSVSYSEYGIGLIEVRSDGTERVLARRGYGYAEDYPGCWHWQSRAPLGRVVQPGASLVLRVRNWSNTTTIDEVGGTAEFRGYYARVSPFHAKAASWPPSSDRIVHYSPSDPTLPPYGVTLATNLAPGGFVDLDLVTAQGPAGSKLVVTDFRLASGCGPASQGCNFSVSLALFERRSTGEERLLRVVGDVPGTLDPCDDVLADGPVGPLVENGSTVVLRITSAETTNPIALLTAWDLALDGYYALPQ